MCRLPHRGDAGPANSMRRQCEFQRRPATGPRQQLRAPPPRPAARRPANRRTGPVASTRAGASGHERWNPLNLWDRLPARRGAVAADRTPRPARPRAEPCAGTAALRSAASRSAVPAHGGARRRGRWADGSSMWKVLPRPLALHPDAAAVRLDHQLAEGEAEPGARERAACSACAPARTFGRSAPGTPAGFPARCRAR